MATETSSSGGIGCVGTTFIVFLILKLVGLITWKWIWVLSPLWIGFAIGLAILGIGALVLLILEHYS